MTKDELKFRAYIEITTYDDNNEEKEVGFYVDNIAVYSDGGIGFSLNNLVDALSPLDITKKQKDRIIDDISSNSYCEDYDWFSVELGIVEQFTGLYDRNNIPIYEGDWLKTADNTYGYVIKDRGFWHIKSLPSEAEDLEPPEFYEKCTVVATYNERPNFMEEVTHEL